MKSNKKTETAFIIFLALVIAGAFSWLWMFGAAGLPETELREANRGRILLMVWLGSSLIFAPLLAKLLGAGFKFLEKNEHNSEDKADELHDEENNS